MLIFDEKNGTARTDCDGFLERLELDFEVCYIKPEIYQDILRLNRYLNSIYEKIRVSNTDMIGLFLTESFAKIHRDYQTVIILVTRGLMSQAKAILRTMLEILFIMVAVSKDHSNYDDWIGTQNRERNKLVDAIKNRSFQVEGIDDSKLVKSSHTKNVSFSKWGKRAGMEWDYNIIYKLFSKNIHCTETAYADDLEIDENGDVIAIKLFPDYKEIEPTLILAKRYVLMAASVARSYFKLEEDDDAFDEYEAFLEDANSNIQSITKDSFK